MATSHAQQAYDLLVCIRCHAYPESIADTAESVRWSCGDRVKVVFAVDGLSGTLGQHLQNIYGMSSVYRSERKWGWGAGLFGLLVESLLYFQSCYNFQHFLTIDYDTLFLSKDADQKLLNLIRSDEIGVIGALTESARWTARFEQDKSLLFAELKTSPKGFTHTFGMQGGCMLLTRALIDEFVEKGIFSSYHKVVSACQLADDHLLPIISRLFGLSLQDAGSILQCTWKLCKDPRGLQDKGVFVFHPVKSDSNVKTEWLFRKYFKELRDADAKKSSG